MTTTVWITDSSVPDVALQLGAKSIGLDECGFLNIIEADYLTDNQRAKLLKKFKTLGFTKITFDPCENGPFYPVGYGDLS